MRSSLSRKSPRAQLLACREQQPRPQRPVAESCQQRRLCLLLLWQRHLQLQGVVVKHPLCCWPLLYLPLQLLPWRRTDPSCLHPQLPAELLYQSRRDFSC